MRKLKLEAETLAVESFVVPGAAAERGTVRANSTEPETHKDEYTCGNSCIAMCGHTMENPDCGVGTDFGCV